MKARPTEYRGILYRSKSEAMFAMFLDHVSVGQTAITYEPVGYSVNGSDIDFMVCWVSGTSIVNGLCLPKVRIVLIEYKPSKPTETYVREFVSKSHEMNRRAKQSFSPSELIDVQFRLFYGSFWDGERGRIDVRDGEAIRVEKDWLIGDLGEEIHRYRFDLESQA